MADGDGSDKNGPYKERNEKGNGNVTRDQESQSRGAGIGQGDHSGPKNSSEYAVLSARGGGDRHVLRDREFGAPFGESSTTGNMKESKTFAFGMKNYTLDHEQSGEGKLKFYEDVLIFLV